MSHSQQERKRPALCNVRKGVAKRWEEEDEMIVFDIDNNKKN